MLRLNELQLAKELIRFPSVTPVDAGVMSFLEKKLKKLGFKTKILEFKEKKTKPVKNLYARLGNNSPNFCYAGHLDVVPAGNLKDWTVNPFKPAIKNGHLIGRGANDMKSSIAAFVAAVSNFVLSYQLLYGPFKFSIGYILKLSIIAFLICWCVTHSPFILSATLTFPLSRSSII